MLPSKKSRHSDALLPLNRWVAKKNLNIVIIKPKPIKLSENHSSYIFFTVIDFGKFSFPFILILWKKKKSLFNFDFPKIILGSHKWNGINFDDVLFGFPEYICSYHFIPVNTWKGTSIYDGWKLKRWSKAFGNVSSIAKKVEGHHSVKRERKSCNVIHERTRERFNLIKVNLSNPINLVLQIFRIYDDNLYIKNFFPWIPGVSDKSIHKHGLSLQLSWFAINFDEYCMEYEAIKTMKLNGKTSWPNKEILFFKFQSENNFISISVSSVSSISNYFSINEEFFCPERNWKSIEKILKYDFIK